MKKVSDCTALLYGASTVNCVGGCCQFVSTKYISFSASASPWKTGFKLNAADKREIKKLNLKKKGRETQDNDDDDSETVTA